MVGFNAELDADNEPKLLSESEEPHEEAIVINEAFLPRTDEQQPQNSGKDMASNTHVNVDSRGGYLIDDVTGSRGQNGSKSANADDSVKCDDAVNKSAISKIAGSESSDEILRRLGWEDGQPIEGGEDASLIGDQTAAWPAVERQTVVREQRNREHPDDVQFTMAPISGLFNTVYSLPWHQWSCD